MQMNKGDIYGRLTLTGNTERRVKGKTKPRKKLFIECVCECGNVVWIEKYSLKHNTRSCGCIQREFATKHARDLAITNTGTGNIIECSFCSKEFSRAKCMSDKNEHNYCSRECMAEHYKERLSGENHPLYNPNRDEIQSEGRQHPDYVVWRKTVYERDGYTCQCCGDKPQKLNAHHIMSFTRFPDMQFNVNNGMTLCKKCHNEFHKVYGRLSFTSDDFYEFLKEKGVSYESSTTTI